MRRYKTAEGDYLVLDEDGNGYFRIWWHIAELDGVGACLGEGLLPDSPPENKYEWESWQADRCAEPFADGLDNAGFFFETKKRAQAALKAANEGLRTGDAPWPAWALQAKAAGWVQPKWWKP